MEGYKSLKEAVESVSSAAKSWQNLQTGAWFDIDELRAMAEVYDEEVEPDGWNYFVTFESSGEICVASTCTREIEFIFVPPGSRYRELIAVQDRKLEELREDILPVLGQMVSDQLDELGDDPAKFAAVFQRDSEMLATDMIVRAIDFTKPGLSRIAVNVRKNSAAENVLRMLNTPGFIEKTAASRRQFHNSPDRLEETDPRTVLDRLDYTLQH